MLRIGVYKKQLGLVLVTVTVLTIMGVFIHLSLQDRESYRWLTRSYEVQTRLEMTLLDVEAGQDAHDDFRLNGNSAALEVFQSKFQRASSDLDGLEPLVADNPQQVLLLHSLRHDIIALEKTLVVSSNEPVQRVGTAVLAQEFALLDRVHRSADSMKQAEQDLLEARARTNRLSQRRVNIAFVCFLVVISLLLVSLFYAVWQDLMQKRAAERLRRAADQRVVHLLENISDAFFALNRDWVVTYMNGQAEKVFSKTRAELVGNNLWAVYPGTEEMEFGRAYRRALQEQVTVRFENYDETRAIWFEIRAYPNDEGLGIFVTNITDRKLTEEERDRLERQTMLQNAAQRRNQELQDLARRLVEIQEAERGHLAHELHEEVGQVLAGLKLSLAGIMKRPESAREEQIQTAQDLVTEVMRHVRSLSLDLRPGVLDDLGLLPALEWYCAHYTEQSEVAVDFTATGLDSRLDGAVETTVYRIVQEALSNVTHHSDVKAIEVRLIRQDEFVELQITDCSVGLSLQNVDCFCDQTSLTGMQERANLIGGTFEVTTGPGEGTTIVARLPIHPIYTSLES